MERWAWFATFVFLMAPLAGCFGADEGVDAAVDDDAGDAPTGPDAEMPDGRGGRIVAFEETNATEAGEGGIDHHHDYWQGRSRVTVAEQNVRMMMWAGATEGVGEIVMGADQMVYEGTASVEVTFSNPQRRACEPVVMFNDDFICTDAGTGTRVDDPAGGPAGYVFQLRHAATTTWIDMGEIDWSAPMEFVVSDAKMTDMPHATNTLWGFRVVSDEPDANTLTFDVKIDILRAEGDIPLWPGHPQFYRDATERVVLEAQAKTREDGLTGMTAEGTPSQVDVVVPERLISYGTKALLVTVTIDNLEILNPAEEPSGWFLMAHNASGRWRSTDWAHPDHPGDATEHTWIVSVSDAGMDSPYADGSRWGFSFRGSFDGGVVVCTGCAAYEVSYTIRVVATNQELGDADVAL